MGSTPSTRRQLDGVAVWFLTVRFSQRCCRALDELVDLRTGVPPPPCPWIGRRSGPRPRTRARGARRASRRSRRSAPSAIYLWCRRRTWPGRTTICSPCPCSSKKVARASASAAARPSRRRRTRARGAPQRSARTATSSCTRCCTTVRGVVRRVVGGALIDKTRVIAHGRFGGGFSARAVRRSATRPRERPRVYSYRPARHPSEPLPPQWYLVHRFQHFSQNAQSSTALSP
jgi:hypothetical protein